MERKLFLLDWSRVGVSSLKLFVFDRSRMSMSFWELFCMRLNASSPLELELVSGHQIVSSELKPSQVGEGPGRR